MNTRLKRCVFALTPIAAACALVACGSSSSSSTPTPVPAPTPATTTFSGVVASTGYIAGSTSGNPTLKAGYYTGATVFVDSNGNGKLDAGEPSAQTDATGHFTLQSSVSGQLVADIPTTASNTATGKTVPSHLILRASTAQVADQGNGSVVISPMSSEVQRLVEANGTAYATEKANLATRLSTPTFNSTSVTVSASDALSDVNKLIGAEQQAVLFEENQLANRYTFATTKLDRGDLYPDNLAVPGNDPTVVNAAGVPASGVVVSAGTTPAKPTVTQAPITFAQAQQAAFNVEGIPRYDNIFVIMLENHSVSATPGTPGILGSTYAPNINKILTSGNQFTTYYSTGNPSEPNYTALGGADDWGITDDNWWGCANGTNNTPSDAAFAGGTASDGQPLVATIAIPNTNTSALSGYTSSACAAGASAAHNVSAPSLFTLISQAGMTWRTYSESMNPGQDPRTDSIADTAVSGAYSGPGGTGTSFTMPASLYKTKHHPGMAYQQTRNLPEFFADNRTIFGTQYASALSQSKAYAIPANYNYDQFSTDLANGDIGNLNFIMPDQCDDMHGTGSDPSCAGGSTAIVQRGDAYVAQVVAKIQASPAWTNPNRHVAIVVMFDEGEGSSTSCCGWNPSTANVSQAPLTYSNGKYSTVATTNYYQGNHGHGNSIFAVLTNQANAPKGIVDSDAYSHFSFVRTLQDMFQLGDPVQPQSYLARAKYSESFITANIVNLPELAGSADTHFDSVRPMNHAFITPANYTQKLNPADVTGTSLASRGPGPDATQTNVWALK